MRSGRKPKGVGTWQIGLGMRSSLLGETPPRLVPRRPCEIPLCPQAFSGSPHWGTPHPREGWACPGEGTPRPQSNLLGPRSFLLSPHSSRSLPHSFPSLPRSFRSLPRSAWARGRSRTRKIREVRNHRGREVSCSPERTGAPGVSGMSGGGNEIPVSRSGVRKHEIPGLPSKLSHFGFPVPSYFRWTLQKSRKTGKTSGTVYVDAAGEGSLPCALDGHHPQTQG
jgi:hypothetical protein